VFAVALMILRYSFLLMLFIFIFRLVKWMISDLQDSPGHYPAEDPAGLLPEENMSGQSSDVKLIVIESSLEELEPGDTFIIGPELVIGRAGGSSIVINDSFASTRHSRVYIKQGQYWLEDLKSTNGTFLNEVIVDRPIVLADGDRIRIGKVTFQFVRWGHEVGSNY